MRQNQKKVFEQQKQFQKLRKMGTAYSVASFDSPNDIKYIWEQAGFHLNTNGNMFRRVHQRLNIEMPNSIRNKNFSIFLWF
jgi:hypothetical protein